MSKGEKISYFQEWQLLIKHRSKIKFLIKRCTKVSIWRGRHNKPISMRMMNSRKFHLWSHSMIKSKTMITIRIMTSRITITRRDSNMIRITNKMINITIRIKNTIRIRTMIKAKLTTINLKTRTMIKITIKITIKIKIKTTIKITTNMGQITSNKITTSRITIITTMMLTTKTITIIKTSTINSTLKKTNTRNGNRASKTPHPKKRRSTDKNSKVFTRVTMKTQHLTSKTRAMIFSIWTLEWI